MADEPTTTPAADSSELVATRAKLEATEQELSNYKLKLADFDNARKRLLRDVETERKYAVEPIVRDLLSAFDNLERALDAAKQANDTGPLATGVAVTANQFLDVLKRHGITRVACEPGNAFDPNLHQAVMQQPHAEFQPGHVIQVLQHGFLLHDRVIRPATVIVSA
jgi:molecular chaperone GrpE